MAFRAGLYGGADQGSWLVPGVLIGIFVILLAALGATLALFWAHKPGVTPITPSAPPKSRSKGGDSKDDSKNDSKDDTKPRTDVIIVEKPLQSGPWGWDPVKHVATPLPRDEPRWPDQRFPAEMGFWGVGEYGPGGVVGAGPHEGGVWYPAGDLAPRWVQDAARYDYPTAAIMHRPSEAVGPYERVGALTRDADSKALPLFGRVRGNPSWGKYDYRTIVGEDVPIELDCGPRGRDWLSSGDTIAVPGMGMDVFTVRLYEGAR